MKRLIVLLFPILFVSCNRPPENGPGKNGGTGIMAEGWITSPQKGILFTKHPGELEFMTSANTDRC